MTTRIDILTLFPEMFDAALGSSILRRAAESVAHPADPSRVRAPVVSYHLTNIRDHTEDKHQKVDQPPFGGGPGMVIQCQPVFDAVRHAEGQDTRPARRVLMTPQGQPLTQALATELSKEPRVLILAGHYEGIDQRVIDALDPITEVSLGDYVLSGGELPAMVLIDAIVRLLPGALGDDQSATEDSFTGDHANLLEGPVYTRPRTWQGRDVPEVLLAGDHGKIGAWRQEQALVRTRARRPDLLGHHTPGTTAPPVVLRTPRAADNSAILGLAGTIDPGGGLADRIKAHFKADEFIDSRLATQAGRVIAFAGLLPATLVEEPSRRGLLALHPLLIAPEVDADALRAVLIEELTAASDHAGATATVIESDGAPAGYAPAADHQIIAKDHLEKSLWLCIHRSQRMESLRGPVHWPPAGG
ncbi:MAG: tRNA (guanosine(37)-N1)-methyltransferase TrmD [Phycisphaeraceae bacterium]